MKLLPYFLVLLLTFFSCLNYANDKLANEFWILTNPEPPFVVQEKNRKLSGYVVDVIQGIMKIANVEQDILIAPWERVEKEARTKGNVLAFALARTEEREAHYHWITSLTANIYSVYTKKAYLTNVERINDLEKFEAISVLENDARHRILQSNGLSNISTFGDWHEAFTAFLQGQTDAIFFSDAGVDYYCSLAEFDCNNLQRIFNYKKTTSFMVLSKLGTDPKLAETILKAAKEYKSSVEYQSTADNWLKKYRQEVTIPMHIEDGTLNLWNK